MIIALLKSAITIFTGSEAAREKVLMMAAVCAAVLVLAAVMGKI